MVGITYSSVQNIYRQKVTLQVAQNRFDRLESELKNLKNETKLYTKLDAEASSSAIMERKFREYFGMGTTRDYWLILPEEDEGTDISEDIKEDVDVPNIVRWWRLFKS